MVTKAAESQSSERAWLLRAILVLQSPRAVFAAIRDESKAAVEARQEPITALVWLAGMAAVLAAPAMNTLMDDPARHDAIVVAILIFFAGGIYGLAAYWVLGAALYYVCRRFGSRGTYRRSRHVLGFALAPLALALLTFWPIRIAVEGRDLFRYGGSDGGHVFADTFYVFVAWSILLLLIGLRAVHGWSRARAVAAVAATSVVSALVVLVSALL
jgi:hypothetical protein